MDSGDLLAELERLRLRLRRMVYALIVVFVSGAALAFGTIYLVDRANHNWCALVTTLDGAYRSQPPTTPTGRQVAYEVHQLAGRLGC